MSFLFIDFSSCFLLYCVFLNKYQLDIVLSAKHSQAAANDDKLADLMSQYSNR